VQSIASLKARTRKIELPDQAIEHGHADRVFAYHHRDHPLRASLIHFRIVPNHAARSLYDVDRAAYLKISDAETGEHGGIPDSAAEV
jgi:hypothetical protein